MRSLQRMIDVIFKHETAAGRFVGNTGKVIVIGDLRNYHNKSIIPINHQSLTEHIKSYDQSGITTEKNQKQTDTAS